MVRTMTKRGMPKPVAMLIAALLALYFVPLGAVPASADHIVVPGDDDVTIVDGAGENCQGIKPTPGSENTTKTIAAGSSFEPGGIVTFTIDYPKVDLDEDDRFRIQDCFVLLVGDDTIVIDQFEIEFVPNEEDFSFQYSLQIPADAPLGATICNFAKTTEGPSASPASNRKADACFVVGGNVRILKVDQDGNPLGGAKFTVSCVTPAVEPGTAVEAVIISGLVTTRGGTTAASSTTVGNTTTETGFTTSTGAIAIIGPSGTVCTVTETEPPPGYQLAQPATQTVTIPIGDSQVIKEFENPRLTGSLRITKVANATGSFTFSVDCDDDAFDRSGIQIDIDAAHLGQPGVSAPLISGIPTGTVCTVTEANNPLFSTTVNVTGGVVTIGGGTSDVVFSNTRLTGAITVAKNIVGAPNGATTSFTFDVNCPGTEYDQSLTIDLGSATSGSKATGQIPTGLSCTVTERSTPNWQVTSVVPAGGVVSVPGTVTFTNTRLAGALNISKAVSPVAGGGVVVEFGDTLTYTLTVSATGNLTQNNVVVTDYVPGFDPARPSSGSTTYVAGSAKCVGSVTVPCTVTQPGADGLITWALGDMAAGTTRQVSFQVVIDEVEGDPGETVAVDILNAGAVQSVQTPKKPSNEVVTPVTAVFPVKQGNPPKVLPRTGSTAQTGMLTAAALGMIGLGLLLMAAGRRRESGSIASS